MFDKKIINWYKKNKRDLPWRKTIEPYYIWLSEIILQQTRVNQGLPYYLKFIEKFKSVEDLANAEEDEVLRTWQGLGYYSRARNLHFTAKFINKNYGGRFPNNYKDLQNLKGVGFYTAAAIASISFNERVPVVDGNVMRVLSRYFEYGEDINSAKTKKWFFEAALELMPNKALSSSDFNQGIMELGATICTPQKPKCENCPISDSCLSFKNKTISNYPVKIKKVKVKKRRLYYILLSNSEGLILNKRGPNDIWESLYELIYIKDITDMENILEFIGNKYLSIDTGNIEIKNTFHVFHKLTHQALEIEITHLHINQSISNLEGYYSFHEAENLPKPIVIANYIKTQINTSQLSGF